MTREAMPDVAAARHDSAPHPRLYGGYLHARPVCEHVFAHMNDCIPTSGARANRAQTLAHDEPAICGNQLGDAPAGDLDCAN